MKRYLKVFLAALLVLPILGLYAVSLQFQDGKAPEWWEHITMSKADFEAKAKLLEASEATEAVTEEENSGSPKELQALQKWALDLARKVYRGVRMSGVREKVEAVNALTARFEAGEMTETEYFAQRRAIMGDNPDDMPSAEDLAKEGLEPLRQPSSVASPVRTAEPAKAGSPSSVPSNYDPTAEYSPDSVVGRK